MRRQTCWALNCLTIIIFLIYKFEKVTWFFLPGSLHELSRLYTTVVSEWLEHCNRVVCQETRDDEPPLFVYLALRQQHSRKPQNVTLQTISEI